MENIRRESVNQIEQTHIRLRQEMGDMSNQLMQRTSDKLERVREEIDHKTKETEKVERFFSFCHHENFIPIEQLINLEAEQRQRHMQTMHVEFEQQLETLKSVMSEEQGRMHNEIRVSRGLFN